LESSDLLKLLLHLRLGQINLVRGILQSLLLAGNLVGELFGIVVETLQLLLDILLFVDVGLVLALEYLVLAVEVLLNPCVLGDLLLVELQQHFLQLRNRVSVDVHLVPHRVSVDSDQLRQLYVHPVLQPLLLHKVFLSHLVQHQSLVLLVDSFAQLNNFLKVGLT